MKILEPDHIVYQKNGSMPIPYFESPIENEKGMTCDLARDKGKTIITSKCLQLIRRSQFLSLPIQKKEQKRKSDNDTC